MLTEWRQVARVDQKEETTQGGNQRREVTATLTPGKHKVYCTHPLSLLTHSPSYASNGSRTVGTLVDSVLLSSAASTYLLVISERYRVR